VNSIGDQSRPALAPGVRLHADRVTGEPVLLYPEGLLHLNAAAHEIVIRCDGQSTAEAIISSLAGEYEISTDTLRHDVLECLSRLHQHKLVIFSE
jgi:coenzyme PQQ biosynthesis protein PqqD